MRDFRHIAIEKVLLSFYRIKMANTMDDLEEKSDAENPTAGGDRPQSAPVWLRASLGDLARISHTSFLQIGCLAGRRIRRCLIGVWTDLVGGGCAFYESGLSGARHGGGGRRANGLPVFRQLWASRCSAACVQLVSAASARWAAAKTAL
jgi:hypothetical protein